MFEGDESIQIREVWDHNLEAEFALIGEIVDGYPYVAVDTKFPFNIHLLGRGSGKIVSGNYYEILKDDVDSLKPIQLGLTFTDAYGGLPTCGTGDKYCIWQFNFREFDVSEDASWLDAIEYHQENGIDFETFRQNGIDYSCFGELLMSSGAVLDVDMNWVALQGGYDFGCLLKLLTGRSCLPNTEEEFLRFIKFYFGNVNDLTHMLKFCQDLRHKVPSKVAEDLGVKRVGVYGQAGSNSFLTYGIYSKLKELFFNGSTEKYAGVLFRLGGDNDKVTTLLKRNVKGKEKMKY